MTYKEVYKHYGSITEIAKAANCDPRNVGNWKQRGIPKKVQAMLQRKTKGALKAE